MRAICLVLTLFLSPFSLAATEYQNRLKLIETENISWQQLQQWQDDLLFPHLTERWLSNNIRTLSKDQAREFLDSADNSAAAWFFAPKWRSELVRREDWVEINREFANYGDPSLKCWYLKSREELGQKIYADSVRTLWPTGNSLPDHCDPYLIAWVKSLKDPTPAIWDRQLKAFYSRNGKLLNYLNKFYKSEEDKALGQFLVDVYNNPEHLISKRYNPNSEPMLDLALAAVNRMAFQDPRSASNLWLQVVKSTPGLSQARIRTASSYLGIAMAKQALPQASYWLTIADPDRSDEIVQHWRLQIALAANDYSLIETYYQELSSELKGSPQWLYWLGMARYKNEGRLEDDNPLNDLAGRRLYYGYLAAGVLGRQPSLNADPDYPPIDIQKLQQIRELQRAKALFLAGDVERAQVEWNLYVRNQDNATQHAAAELALSWGWYAKSSQAAGWSGRYDLIHLRYPDAFGPIVEYHAEKYQLPLYWVYGIMRQESRYDQAAVSPAGAHGLMQIMPATAKATARRYGIPYKTTTDLYEPSTNIAIATSYMNDLMKQFDNPVYATAAYNAGPSRVTTWRSRFPAEMTVWIESIPFDETRNYVKSVLAYSQIYALTSSTPWHLASWTMPAATVAQLK